MASSIRSQRIALTFSLILLFAAVAIPYPVFAAERDHPSLPDLATFAKSVQNGRASDLRGVYADGLFALPVVAQPGYGSYYVSTTPDVLTEFGSAAAYGNVGLLAHDFLSGKDFFKMTAGQRIVLVYGDGHLEYYAVTQIDRYQAADPYSVQSNFVDLATKDVLSATQLFKKVYMGARHVTFQTCIAANGNSSWGRLFVIAEPAPQPSAN